MRIKRIKDWIQSKINQFEAFDEIELVDAEPARQIISVLRTRDRVIFNQHEKIGLSNNGCLEVWTIILFNEDLTHVDLSQIVFDFEDTEYEEEEPYVQYKRVELNECVKFSRIMQDL